MGRKKKEESLGGLGEWIVTYGDMVTLLLTFFVALMEDPGTPNSQWEQMVSSLNNTGLGGQTGGNTLSSGKLAELGNTIAALPSMQKGNFLGTGLRKATSLFQPEVKSNKVRVTMDERGVVISLASDAFFRPASAEVDIEATRSLFLKLAELLKSPEVAGRKFRIEGHTDSAPVDPRGAWPSNWDLSAARAINTLEYLVDFGVEERRFQVAGFADTAPIAANDTEEGRAYNRRVDVVILDEAHL